MIYDKLSNLKKYSFDNKGLSEAVDVLNNLDLMALGTGYKAVYDNFSISVNEYMSKPVDQARYEMHQKAIDIHIVLDGTEYVECTSIDEVIPDGSYDAAHDIAFGVAECNCSILLKAGWFLICYPQDAHLVGAHLESPDKIRKCVVKVKC